MKDQSKTKAQLIAELVEFRQRVAELETAEADRKRGEEGIGRSEEKYRRIFEELQDLYYRTDAKGMIEDVSPSAKSLGGYDREDLIGMPVYKLFKNRSDRLRLTRALLESGNVTDYELTLLRKNGEEIEASASSHLIYDENRRPIGIEGVLRDITRRKRADEEIRRLKEFNEGIIQNMTEGIVVENAEGFYTFVNPVAASMLGYSSEELVGKHWTMIVPSDNQPEVQAADERRKHGQSDQYELELERKDGTRVPILVSGSPRSENGEFAGALVVFTDITERRCAEQALRESEERFRHVAENSEEWIWEVDTNGKYTYASPVVEKVLGYRVDEIVGEKCFYDLFHPEDKEERQEIAFEAFSERRAFREFINRNIHKSGRVVWLSTSGVPILDEKGSLLGYRGADTDITNRKQLEARLRQAAKMEAIGKLAGGIAHDFNNLLTVIRGYSQMMLKRFNSDGPDYEDMLEIKNACERATELTQQLLAFGRKQIVRPKVLDLNAVVSDTERMLRRIVSEDIDFGTQLAPDLWNVKIDPGQIDQILVNIAGNARDAMPDGGRLTIKTANIDIGESNVIEHVEVSRGQYVMLAMGDTGMGMDDETLSRVFEPFFSTKERGKGTGLGLSTVYGIVKQNNGYIWLSSEFGTGTVVTIYLPREMEDVESSEPDRTHYKSTRGTETVLLVEDDVAVRRLAKRILIKSGYSVLEAAEGEEALRINEQYSERVHLLVTDVIMPGMSGKELADRIISTHPEIKVIFISGYTDDVLTRRGVLGPGTDLIHKPFSPEALLEKVREVLERAGKV